jgi:lysophospholipase L1-like esterase
MHCAKKSVTNGSPVHQSGLRNHPFIFYAFVAVAALIPFSAVSAEYRQDIKGKAGVATANAHVVIIGASYAKSWELPELDGLKVVNRGVGGEQTHEVLARFDSDVVASAPRAVIIWGFINDIFRSTPDEVETKLVRSRENLNAMIEKARSKGIIPIVATEVTLPVGDTWSDRLAGWVGALRGKQGYQDYINGHVVEMNHWLRRTAAEKKLTVLDFEKALADSKGRRKPEYATPDGTHLSLQAYVVLTDYTKRMNLGI